MNFCETDPVFSEIHRQLTSVKDVDFDVWLSQSPETEGAVVGSGKLQFPTDEEQRMAIIYELLRRIHSDKLGFINFIYTVFTIPNPNSNVTSYIETFNEAVTAQFVRALKYRLQDVADELPEDKKASVPLALVQIIHHATNVVQQNAIGSGNTQSAVQTVTNEIDKLFDDLKQAALAQPSGIEKKEIEEIIETALAAAKDEKPRPTVVKRLLGMLPPTAAVLSITASILKLLELFNNRTP